MKLTNKNIIVLGEVESTNNYAMQLVSDKAKEGTVVLAQYQSRGRGQAGRYWESEAEKNLLMSVILEPTFLEAGKQFYLSMIVSLALVQFLRKHISEVSIKWPNDIYVDERKIAGILIENSIKGSTLEKSVVGIGLNINQELFTSDAPNPVSLKQLTGKEYLLPETLDEFLEDLEYWYQTLCMKDFATIRQAYSSALFRKSGWYLYRAAGEEFLAQIVGVAEFGQLLLEDRTGKIRTYMFKEVEFVI